MSDQAPEAALQFAENFLRAQIVALEAERARADLERARIDAEITKTKNALAEMMMRIGTATALPELPINRRSTSKKCSRLKCRNAAHSLALS